MGDTRKDHAEITIPTVLNYGSPVLELMAKFFLVFNTQFGGYWTTAGRGSWLEHPGILSSEQHEPSIKVEVDFYKEQRAEFETVIAAIRRALGQKVVRCIIVENAAHYFDDEGESNVASK